MDASRGGKKGLKSCRDKNASKARTVVGRAEEPSLLRNPGSDLRLLGAREKRRGDDSKWDENREEEKRKESLVFGARGKKGARPTVQWHGVGPVRTAVPFWGQIISISK